MFIAVDGIDGAGKTTLVRRIATYLKDRGCNPLVTKEPTGESHWGRELRRAAKEGRLTTEQEVHYFHEDRKHHIKTEILPALDSGRIVITDRYVDSTLAYQAKSTQEADRLYRRFLEDGVLVPDVTFILCCEVEIGLRRIAMRGNGDKSTFETTDTLNRAKEIFESRTGQNYVQIDANRDADTTFRQVMDVLSTRFPFFRESMAIDGNYSSDGSRLRAVRKAVG